MGSGLLWVGMKFSELISAYKLIKLFSPTAEITRTIELYQVFKKAHGFFQDVVLIISELHLVRVQLLGPGPLSSSRYPI